jgi:hypothetical protein
MAFLLQKVNGLRVHEASSLALSSRQSGTISRFFLGFKRKAGITEKALISRANASLADRHAYQADGRPTKGKMVQCRGENQKKTIDWT